MNTSKIIELSKEIEKYRAALKWIEEYRDQFEKPGSHTIRVEIHSASACPGSGEARYMFERLLRSKAEKLIDETIRECEVGIGRCENEIRELTAR